MTGTEELILVACAYVGADPDTVLKFRTDEDRDEAYLILDLGIKGCPKHTFALSDLEALVPIVTVWPIRIIEPEATAPRMTEVEIEIDATPMARKLAAANGVDLTEWKGEGRIGIAAVRKMIAAGG